LNYLAIFGLMRSGTTWIGKVLDSSPDVIYLHEPDYVKRIPCLPYTTEAEDYLGWEPYIRRYLAGLRSSCASRSMLKRPSFPKSFPSTLFGKISYGTFRGMLRIEQLLHRAGFSPVAVTWPKCVDNANLVVWKSVEQTGNIGCFLRAVPEQKILHVVRHPCGFVDSVMRGQRKKLLHGGVPASQDLGIFDYVIRTKFAHQLGLKLRDWEKLSGVERLAYMWLVVNEQAILDGEEMPNYKLVYFEEFCFNPVKMASEVYDFAGLSLGPQTERFISSSSGSTGSEQSDNAKSQQYYSVSRNSKSVPRSWEQRLSKDSIDRILKIAGLSDRMTKLLGKPVGAAKPRVD
jgi:hypothetical protein